MIVRESLEPPPSVEFFENENTPPPRAFKRPHGFLYKVSVSHLFGKFYHAITVEEYLKRVVRCEDGLALVPLQTHIYKSER